MQLDDIGLLIRKKRKQAGLSIQTLAELSNVHRTMLSKLENRRLPEMGYAKLARVLAVLELEMTTKTVSDLPTLNDLIRMNREDE